MDLKTLRLIVSNGEDLYTEFKLKSNYPEKIAREMVAFANSEGGRLIIGVADNREIKGLKYADEDLFLLEKTFKEAIAPPLRYELERVSINQDNEVLVFTVEPQSDGPYILTFEGISTVYIRYADKALKANKEMREVLKGKAKNRSYGFQYGEKENLLVKYLDQNKTITVSKFSKIADINKHVASRTLVLMVLAGILEITPHEIEDTFSLKSAA